MRQRLFTSITILQVLFYKNLFFFLFVILSSHHYILVVYHSSSRKIDKISFPVVPFFYGEKVPSFHFLRPHILTLLLHSVRGTAAKTIWCSTYVMKLLETAHDLSCKQNSATDGVIRHVPGNKMAQFHFSARYSATITLGAATEVSPNKSGYSQILHHKFYLL